MICGLGTVTRSDFVADKSLTFNWGWMERQTYYLLGFEMVCQLAVGDAETREHKGPPSHGISKP